MMAIWMQILSNSRQQYTSIAFKLCTWKLHIVSDPCSNENQDRTCHHMTICTPSLNPLVALRGTKYQVRFHYPSIMGISIYGKHSGCMLWRSQKIAKKTRVLKLCNLVLWTVNYHLTTQQCYATLQTRSVHGTFMGRALHVHQPFHKIQNWDISLFVLDAHVKNEIQTRGLHNLRMISQIVKNNLIDI